MFDFERLREGDQLEAAPESHRLSSRERLWLRASRLSAAVAAVGSLALVSAVIEHQEADEEPGKNIVFMDEFIAEQQDRLNEHEAMRLTGQADVLERGAEQVDPYINERELVILLEEPVVKDHKDHLELLAAEFDVNVNHLAATGMVESCWNSSIPDSHVGAQGALQVMPDYLDWFRELYGDRPYDPQNITHSLRMGAAAYAMLLGEVDTIGLTPEQQLQVGGTAYNAGPSRAQTLIDSSFDHSVLPTETQGHLEELMLIFDSKVQDREGTTRCRK